MAQTVITQRGLTTIDRVLGFWSALIKNVQNFCSNFLGTISGNERYIHMWSWFIEKCWGLTDVFNNKGKKADVKVSVDQK